MTIIAQPATASNTVKAARDHRIDVIRGLVLIMIYINHGPYYAANGSRHVEKRAGGALNDGGSLAVDDKSKGKGSRHRK